MISHARINFQIPIASWQQEINNLPDYWHNHFNKTHYQGSWTVLPLRSPGGNVEAINPDILGNETFQDTPLLQNCPAISKWLNQLHCPLMSVRLLNLQCKSVIKEHRDHGLSFEQGEARLHIPVFTNPLVDFYLDNTLLRMREGECWYINANLPHRVSNNGSSDRIHLVIDCLVNDWLQEIFNQADKTSSPREGYKRDLINIIRELRLQGTSTANVIADQLEKESLSDLHEN
jgi:hypothetical protein